MHLGRISLGLEEEKEPKTAIRLLRIISERALEIYLLCVCVCVKTEIYETIILSVVLYGCET